VAMMMDWKEKYIRQFCESEITQEKTNSLIQEFVDELNNILKKYYINGKEVSFNREEKRIVFPDCFIVYSIKNGKLEFNNLNHNSVMKDSCSLSFIDGVYVFNNAKRENEYFVEYNKDVIDRIMKYLLRDE